ncbi:MAG: hemerythrin domain-containing protein [Elusimicrobia bacterium]|nr:hemerythrin domain-containing protein [Elusimicrobiota bacterium]
MAKKTGIDQVSGYYQQDHREIDELFQGADFESPADALPVFKEFARRLERHIRWEEELLFSRVIQKEPMLEMGPIRVMREEHRQIRRLRDEAIEGLKKGDGKPAASAANQMKNILMDHNRKEEGVLYPACDQLLGTGEKERLFDEMERLGG